VNATQIGVVISLALWALALAAAAVAVAAGRRYAAQAKPLLSSLAPMFQAMNSTGGGSDVTAATVPPDRCEYDDHVWSPPYNDANTTPHPHHYCTVCGYDEPLPGL